MHFRRSIPENTTTIFRCECQYSLEMSRVWATNLTLLIELSLSDESLELPTIYLLYIRFIYNSPRLLR